MKTISATQRGRSWWMVSASALIATAGMWSAISTATAEPTKADSKAVEEGPDTLIFKDGKVYKGTIVSETSTTLKFKGVVSGIAFEAEYNKLDLLKIVKGERKPDGSAPVKPAADAKDAAAPAAKPAESAGDAKNRYYWITLEGEMGEQISETPLREGFNDARANNANTVIIEFRPSWNMEGRSQLPELVANFDELFRAERITQVITDDVPKDWPKPPRIAIWVKNAMGGGVFLPLVCKELYFSSEAKMGGIGNLGNLFDGQGDDVVRAKQKSLRMGHAEGWCITGGYDFRLIRAMAFPAYVLSYRMKDGKVELFEGYPTNAGEELLTDDGKDERKDSADQILRGEGNDVLNIDARRAEILGLSRKTVDSRDDLLAAMDLSINSVEVKGRSKNITKDWDVGVEGAKRQLKKLRDDYAELRVQPPADYGARTKFRGQQRSVLDQMIRILKSKYAEGLTPRWLGENQIPAEAAISGQLDRIRLEQTKDKK